MNFLAHLFLSGQSEEIMIGNFIGDFVKGSNFQQYSPRVKNGIQLHRKIDTFTDQHPIVKNSTSLLRKKYRHYSPVIVDIFYDHFLASQWKSFSSTPLKQFVSDFYSLSVKFMSHIPTSAQHTLFHMKKDDWLYHYQFIEGISRTLSGMSQRTTFRSKMEEATADLTDNYVLFRQDFENFFPELISFSKSFLETIDPKETN